MRLWDVGSFSELNNEILISGANDNTIKLFV